MTMPADDRDHPGPPADDGVRPGPKSGSSGHDPDAEALTRMLTALADDHDAPPSSVTTESVLAAARAEHASRPPPTAVPGEGRPVTSRRRTGLIALVAAAALAGVAAIVVPLALNSSGSSNTASNSAAEATGATTDPTVPVASAPAPGSGGAPAPGAGSGQEDSSAVVGAAPAGSPNAAQPDAAGASAAAGDAAGGEACWPALSPAASAALTGALPTGAFDAPGQLLGSCEQQAVAGAELTGSVPGTELVVRVVTADPGACARSAGEEAGSRCVASGNGGYTATDPSGALTVLVYGNGKEVAVGSRPAAQGVPPVPTGLTSDQLDAAARAVLESLR